MANGQWYPAGVARPHPRARGGDADRRSTPQPRRRPCMLLRDAAAQGPAVHMLRSRASMAFAGGAYAYPGGGVDPRDDDAPRRLGRARAARRGPSGSASDEPRRPGDRVRRGARDVRGGGRPARRARRPTPSSATPRATTGRRTARPWSPASCPSPSSWTGAAWSCAATCSAPGRAGSPRSSSRAATTPGSSWPRCPQGQRTRNASDGGRPHGVDPARRRRRRRTTRASC